MGVYYGVDPSWIYNTRAGGLHRLVTDGLVLLLDAGNTSSYRGSGTTWTDLSGNGNNGTLINTPTYSSANGGHLLFDGTNERLDLASDLDLSTNTGFTMCLFLQQTTPQTGTGWNYFFNRLDPFIEIGTFGTAGTTFSFKDFSIPIEINSGNVTTSWSYIAFGTNPSTRTPFIHRFNSSGYALTTSATAFTNTTLSFSKMFAGAGGANYAAKVATIQAYNRRLTATEVTQNYNVLKGRFGLS